MGIDVYMRWKEMTESDRRVQYTVFEVSAQAGGNGYLREAYHGSPYATRVLVPEGFDDDPDGVAIPVETLRERLPAAIKTAHLRGRTVYKDPTGDQAMADALTPFVGLAERLAKEGKVPRVYVSH